MVVLGESGNRARNSRFSRSESSKRLRSPAKGLKAAIMPIFSIILRLRLTQMPSFRHSLKEARVCRTSS